MNIMKTTAFRRELTEPTSDETSCLIFGNAFILLSGRKTRKVRSALTLKKLNCIISIIPVITTTVSSQFHASRKYAFLCRIKPWAKILKSISIVKRMVRTSPTLSRFQFHRVKLSRSLQSQMARTMELMTMRDMTMFVNIREHVKLTKYLRTIFLKSRQQRERQSQTTIFSFFTLFIVLQLQLRNTLV